MDQAHNLGLQQKVLAHNQDHQQMVLDHKEPGHKELGHKLARKVEHMGKQLLQLLQYGRFDY
jgi:hypothetical protein